MCRQAAAAVLASVLSLPAAAFSAEPVAPLALPVPGTTASLARAAGLERSLPRWRLLREIVRHAYADPLDTKGAAGRLQAYIALVNRYQVLLAGAADPDGRVSLAAAQRRASRERLDDFLDFVGLDLKERRKVYRVERREGGDVRARREVLAQTGLDLEGLERALNDGGSFVALLPEDTVPLPLPLSAWEHVFGERVPLRQLAWAILGNRQAALFYHGLAALDPDTRRYLAATPELLARFLEAAPAFSTLSGAFRIAEGRVEVPGGRRAEALWAALAGEPPTPVVPFARRLFSKDDGRFAYFFDALSRLDPARQAFALGLHERDAGIREARFRALYDASGAVFVSSTPATAPFNRVTADAASLLARVRVGEDGKLAGPAWTRLWRKAFEGEGLPGDPEGDARQIDRDGVLDAAALVELVAVPAFQPRVERTAAFLFAQRVFPGAVPGDAAHLLVTLRGFPVYRALAPTLERMGIGDASLFDRATWLASRLSAIPDLERRARALAQFQGSLALLERVRFAGVVEAEGARALVQSLVELPLSEDGEYLGHVAAWLQQELLPALARQVGIAGQEPAENVLLAALAGASNDDPAPVGLVWEDQGYTVDRPGAVERRLARLREGQAGDRLEAVLELAGAAAALATAVTTVDAIGSRVAAVRSAAGGLQQPRRLGGGPGDAPPELKAVVGKAAQNALKVKKPRQLGKLPGIALPVIRVGDAALAATLASFAYLPSLGDPEGVAAQADLASRHDFGLAATSDAARTRTSWAVPGSEAGASGRRISGSLLAMDAGMARFALRRVSEDRLPGPPTVNEGDYQSIAEGAAFANPRELHDADRDRIARAVEAGDARVRALGAGDKEAAAVAGAARVSSWRREALAWAVAHEPEAVPSFFSLSELMRIGLEPPGSAALDAWGTSDFALGGRLGLQWPDPVPAESLEGHYGAAGLAPWLPDASVWVAVALADRHLPAELAADVLAFAQQDFVDQAQLLHPNDWISAAGQVRQTPVARIDDYVAALTVNGPLVPRTDGHDKR